MKKIYLPFVAFLLCFFPLKAFAAVDITVEDNSTTSIDTVSVSVDTGTDTLESIVIPVQYSDDVTITEVNTGTITCSSFDYAESTNMINITCEFDTATAMDGVIANILFSSTSTDYTFTVSEENENLDVGTLEVGEIVNVGEIEEDTTVEDTTTENDYTTTIAATTNEDTTTSTDSSLFSTENITEYLPYVLIAGSVVLLISIIGILLSKKKPVEEVQDVSEPQETTTPPPTSEPKLKDMVNQDQVQKEIETPVETASVQPQQPQEDKSMTQTVNKPLETNPTVQVPEMVAEQQSASEPQPMAPESEEEQDLQEILKNEASNTVPTPPVINTPATPQEQVPNTPIVNTAINPTVQTQEPATAVPQQTPVVAPTTEGTPTEEELPPVPPTM